MKKYFLSLTVLAVCLTTIGLAKSSRVHFEKGKSSAILKGVTTGGPSESGGMDPVGYTLGASKGQTMTLHLTSSKKNAVFGLYAPGYDLVEGAQSVTDWTGKLPKTGDYEIIVFPQDEATNTNFTLEVTIK